MLFLVFLCMVALAVALCRVGRIEKSLDMMTLMQSAGRASPAAPSTLSGGYSFAPVSYAPPPLPAPQPLYHYQPPIQLPIPPPPSSDMLKPYF